MQARRSIAFIGQSILFGLAIAFILVVLWPALLPSRVVEVREAVPAPAPPATGRDSGPVSYAAAVAKATPSVVNINTAKLVSLRNPFFDDPLFRQFFGGNIQPEKRLETSLGSGVIVSDRGYILTNHHVVKAADTVQVSLHDGRTAQAEVIGSDPESDLAVLKINLPRITAIAMGASDKIRVGDVVLAIGNPFGVGQTVTMGIVSATGRNQLGINTFENFIQTDAAINPGNSGGALIDANGHLIGINTAIFTRSGGSQGIGFAIPTSLGKEVLEQIVQHGRPLRGWLGIEAQAITPELANALDLKETRGVIVAGVVRGGPADKAGIRRGDVIRAIGGEKITDAHGVLMSVSKRKPGTKVPIEIVRENKATTVEATLADRPNRNMSLE